MCEPYGYTLHEDPLDLDGDYEFDYGYEDWELEDDPYLLERGEGYPCDDFAHEKAEW